MARRGRKGIIGRRFWRRVKREGIEMICVYCDIPVMRKLPLTDPQRATVDHVVPVSKGGGHHFENLVIACRACNEAKGYSEI